MKRKRRNAIIEKEGGTYSRAPQKNKAQKGIHSMKAQLIVNKNFTIGKVDDRLYSSMVEHIGRDVYGGLYEPGHETADDMGFRTDVMELVKQLDLPLIRYPGGNFVSQYNWEDGTGDKSKRPKKMEIAFQTIETNEVGIDEFQEWARRVGSSVMHAVNLGTRGADEARNLVEYCNSDTDTYYANMRRQNGFEKPFGFKVWCLGNEMGGASQIFRKTPDEYGRLVRTTARAMRAVDPDIELVACGSSSRGMQYFGEWEMTLLNYAYSFIDYLSIHQYYTNSGNVAKFLGKSTELNRFIKSVVAICDLMKEKFQTNKTINIAFDEWNVLNVPMNRPEDELWVTGAPRIEQINDLADALMVGCMMMTLQNNCDRVKISCFNTLINCIAPIMTETGGKAWAQTIFYPFLYASKNGRGVAARPVVKCDTYTEEDISDIPYLEASAIFNDDKREITVFAVNRSLTKDMELDLRLEDFGECRATEHVQLYHDDLGAKNTAEKSEVLPENVALGDRIVLKKHSWNMLKFKY